MRRLENQRMEQFLRENGIIAKAKYIWNGSLCYRWRLYNPKMQWSEQLAEKLTALGFSGFDNQPLHKFSGNGGLFSVFVRGHDDIAMKACGEALKSRLEFLGISTESPLA